MFASQRARISALMALMLPALAVAQEPATPKIRRATRHAQFNIPFSLDRTAADIAEVRLYMSVDRGRTWQVADVRRPDAKAFPFRAPADGAYWFTSRTVDRARRQWPQEPLAAELEVVVDTTQPQLDVTTSPSGAVSWSAWDPLLTAQGVQVQVQAGGVWKPLPVPSRRAGGRWEGSATVPTGVTEVRVVAVDQAGNRAIESQSLRQAMAANSAEATAKSPRGERAFSLTVPGPESPRGERAFSLTGPGPESPWWAGGAGSHGLRLPQGIPSDPMQSMASTATASDHPSMKEATDETPAASVAATEPVWKPRSEEYAATRQQWPAQNAGPKSPWDVPPPAFVAKPAKPRALPADPTVAAKFSAVGASSATAGPNNSWPRKAADPVIGPVGPAVAQQRGAAGETDSAENSVVAAPPAAPPGMSIESESGGPLQVMPGAVTKTTVPGFSKVPSGPAPDAEGALTDVRPQWSNRMRFSMDYQLDSILNENVGEVELWATADGGETWSRWGTDPDKQSPVSVKIEDEGVYGFDVVVVSDRGMASSRPASPQDADVWIGVDVTPPTARWGDLGPGKGEHEGHLDMRWTLEDKNLAQQPVSIAYSASPSGPWTSIVTDMENDGRYLWLPTPSVPEKVYLQLKAVDLAGNVAEVVTPDPFVLYGLRPRANIRAVLPK